MGHRSRLRLGRWATVWGVMAIGLGCDFVSLPKTEPMPPIPLEQGQAWKSDAELRKFHHFSQGTKLMPEKWFRALRQPALFGGRVADPDYLSRFGFIQSPKDTAYNPHALPVGFAIDGDFKDPVTGEDEPMLGFTCAACHTGELRFEGKAYRVDGGAAMTDLGKFRTALAYSILATYVLPWRFNDFADAVCGEEEDGCTEVQRQDLKLALRVMSAKQLSNFDAQQHRFQGCCEDGSRQNQEEGFGRLDAIGRIGNHVFAAQGGPGAEGWQNFEPLDAPVAYPHIWDTHWFDWVQYNGSIHQPLARNVGEALGVNAPVQLRGAPEAHFASTVKIDNLFWLESFLAGERPFEGLLSPRWHEDFGAIDGDKAQRGAELYEELCAECHGDVARVADPDSNAWIDGETRFGVRPVRMLPLTMKEVDAVGTDPAQAINFRKRMLALGDLRIQKGLAGANTAEAAERWYRQIDLPREQRKEAPERASLGVALDGATQLAAERWYAAAEERGCSYSEEEKWVLNGRRPSLVRDRAPADTGKPVYRVRPLNGVWATAPFLHNGSVRTLYQLLLPAEQREKTFCLGSKDFDPKDVGFESECGRGYFEFDTSLPGNSNAGHEFVDGPDRAGRLGRGLEVDERYALIEFIKTIEFGDYRGKNTGKSDPGYDYRELADRCRVQRGNEPAGAG
ncbi:MAG: di-heme-cytochrome C peroxidase [Myxococcota bacterium]